MNYLGIDVSKRKIDCCLIVGDKYLHRVLKNDQSGFEKLRDWLKKYTAEPVYACLEATGIYSEHIADWLHDEGHSVALTNPLSIKKFAEMQLLAVKTDKQDAKTIAKYCRMTQPTLYAPPPKSERQLKALTRQVEYLKEMVVANQNRFQVSQDVTAPIIADTIAHLRQQIAQVEQQIQTHIKQSPDLKDKADLLKSVRGIGAATIPHLITLFGFKTFQTAKAAIKYVGLNPIIKQSGEKKTRFIAISKQGDKTIRTALYMPAVRAFTLPEWQPFVNRLKAAGKTGKQIVCAIMRKLLVYCFTVLKSGRPYDPQIQAA